MSNQAVSFVLVAVTGSLAALSCEEPPEAERAAQQEELRGATTGTASGRGLGATTSTATSSADAVEHARAKLQAAPDQEIEGEIRFAMTAQGVHVTADINEAKPGKHGFHIHEKGDCSDIPGKSMGGHFSPMNHPHALPSEDQKRHLGDLGNIEIGDDGKGRLEMTLRHATMTPGNRLSILGKAVVVHGGEDSGKANQPAGDSGTPIACGVIEPTEQ